MKMKLGEVILEQDGQDVYVTFEWHGHAATLMASSNAPIWSLVQTMEAMMRMQPEDVGSAGYLDVYKNGTVVHQAFDVGDTAPEFGPDE